MAAGGRISERVAPDDVIRYLALKRRPPGVGEGSRILILCLLSLNEFKDTCACDGALLFQK